MTYDDAIPPDFRTTFYAVGLNAASRAGYAVPVPKGSPLSSEERRRRVSARADRAYAALVDLQQWLVDDSPLVRQAARHNIRRIMYRAYTGDENEFAGRPGERRQWADRLLERFLTRNVNPDGPLPWWREPARQAATRRLAIVAAFFAALTAGVLLGRGYALWALPLIVVAAVFDVFDGAFARVSRMRDARLRWLSCISSHAGDMLLVAGIAYGDEYGPLGSGYGGWILGAALVTLFGSFVRTSALQAAYRFWRSPLERIVRYGAVVVFCALSAADQHDSATTVVVVMLAGFGLWETLRVVRGVEKRPAAQDGGIVFIDSDQEVHAFGISDESESRTWASIDDSTDHDDEPTLASPR